MHLLLCGTFILLLLASRYTFGFSSSPTVQLFGLLYHGNERVLLGDSKFVLSDPCLTRSSTKNFFFICNFVLFFFLF
ncbi:hypothetical protein HanRHA438_Chr02g0058171 [Helianthus annuus]|nr:hypothetical protein HanRHA438_Chr02g0058171 [Helianthus annuus]